MWEAAALAAAAVRPALMTIIGFVSATSRAAERNDRAFPEELVRMLDCGCHPINQLLAQDTAYCR